MNSKERVRYALSRERLPDRVPLEFDLCRSLLEAFGNKLQIPVHYTNAIYEDITYRLSGNEIRIAMGSDCVHVGASLPKNYEYPKDENGYIINEMGMVMRPGPVYVEVVKHPLAKIKTIQEVIDFQFPDPLADGRYDDAEKYIQKYGKEYFIIGNMELTMYDMMHELVGTEKLLLDLALGAEYLEPLMDKTKEFALTVGKKLVSMGVDGIWAGDDFGAQNGMIMSPKMWRHYFKERYREVYSTLKAINPDLIIMQHCDGAIAPILDDWIEVGLQVFNPVQPNVPGHEPEDLKSKFGDRMSFWGAIDQQQLLPNGSAEEIEADVARKINILGKCGGYLCSPAHIIQSDTSIENVEVFINAVKKYGVY